MSRSPSPHRPSDDDVANSHLAAPISPSESAPLLGRPGSLTQPPSSPITYNLLLGTGYLAQLGLLALLTTILYAITTHPTLPLVSPHPILQSFGLIALVQAILILQPTFRVEEKAQGQKWHAALQALALAAFAAGVVVIEVNKKVNHMPHWHSLHGVLGTTAAGLLVLQGLFGLTIWATPRVWGGEERAKGLWKYHRWVGYAVLFFLLATVASAAETTYVKKVLEVKLWTVLVAEALILLGVVPRIHSRKLGIQPRDQ